jgi:hypothetical protein
MALTFSHLIDVTSPIRSTRHTPDLHACCSLPFVAYTNSVKTTIPSTNTPTTPLYISVLLSFLDGFSGATIERTLAPPNWDTFKTRRYAEWKLEGSPPRKRCSHITHMSAPNEIIYSMHCSTLHGCRRRSFFHQPYR